MEELLKAVKSIKYGKTCGLDEIPVEVWKLKEFHEILLECCNSVYQQEVISSWRKGCILPFPKRQPKYHQELPRNNPNCNLC